MLLLPSVTFFPKKYTDLDNEYPPWNEVINGINVWIFPDLWSIVANNVYLIYKLVVHFPSLLYYIFNFT